MAALVPLGVAGAAALALARSGRPRADRGLAVTLAPAAGFGTLSLAYFGWRLVGLSSASFAVPAWAGVTAAALWGLVVVWRGRGGAPVLLPWRPAAVPLALLALAGAAYLAAAFVLHSRQAPVGQFDAWAIWTSRARLLFRSADPERTFELLRRPHPDYPLLLPGALAGQFALGGGPAMAVPRWTGALFAAAGIAVVGVGVRLLGGAARWAWAAAALLASTPLWIFWGFGQCADVPLAYLTAAAALALGLQVGGAAARPPVSPALAGFLAGLAAWTKNEGMILSLLLLGLFGLWTAAARRWRALGRVAAGAALPWAAVLAFKLAWKPRSDLSFFFAAPWEQALQPARWRFVAAAFLERLDPIGGFADWGLVWLLSTAGLATTLAFGARKRPEIAYLLAVVGVCWIAWFGIFLSTPQDVEWHVRTALDRLMLQLLPVTLMTAFAGVAATPERRE